MTDMQAICRIDDIDDESAREFQVGDQAVMVVKYEGRLHAYLNWCPHLGIELNFMPDQFMDEDRRFLTCVNHGALFEPESGHCLAGPCSGDKLISVPLEVRGEEIWVGHAEAPA